MDHSARSRIAAAVARTLAMGTLAALPTLTLAQEVSLEEVIVTAERRETALQDTPLSIIALSSEALENKGVEDIQDLTVTTPNVAIQGGRGSGNNSPSFLIRGISGGGGATGERGVGLYIDGIYVPRTSGTIFRVFDVERIEVLRGPQGTLFGRNSTGGAIRMVTKQPSQEFDAWIRGTVGNMDRKDIMGMVNLPISDTLAFRGQAAYMSQDGYVRRGPQLLGSSTDKLARIQLAWKPNTDFSATVGLMYSNSKSDGNTSDIVLWDMRPDLNFQGNFADWLSDALEAAGQPRLDVYQDPRLVLDDYTMPGFCFLDDFDPDWDDACLLSNNSEYTQADLNMQWRINDDLSFSSVTGYSKLESEGYADWQMLGFESRPTGANSKTFYQEFQLNASLFNDRVTLVSGLNYFREDSDSPRSQIITRWGSSVFPLTPNGNTIGPLRVTADGDTYQTTTSYGLFTSATWHITDKLNFTAGGRYSYDEKDYEATRYARVDFVPAPGTDHTTVETTKDWEDIDWRATLDYHFHDNVMLYGTASKAHRAGAIAYTIQQNIPGPIQSQGIAALPPEEVKSYELGLRTTFFNNRLRINPTAYYMEWSNRQSARNVSCVAEGEQACPLGFRVQLVNSGDVDVWGYELDAQLAVTRDFTIDGALGITDFRLHDPVANGGPNLNPSQPSPTWNVGATYRIPTETYGRFTVNVNFSYNGSQETYPTSTGDSAYLLPSYELLGARLQWMSKSGRNTVTVFGNNLLDSSHGTFASAFGGGFWDANPVPAAGPNRPYALPDRKMVSEIRSRPREFGITVQHNFN